MKNAAAIQPVTPSRNFTLGVDLGQTCDSSVFALVSRVTEGSRQWDMTPQKQRIEQPTIRYEVNYIRSIPLNTSYTDVVADLVNVYRNLDARAPTDLVVDQSGVGRPMADLIKAEGIRFAGVTILGIAETRQAKPGEWRISRNELISRYQAGLSSGDLKYGAFSEREHLREETIGLTGGYTGAGNFRIDTRSGAHDDRVVAASLAYWWASKPRARARVVKVIGV